MRAASCEARAGRSPKSSAIMKPTPRTATLRKRASRDSRVALRSAPTRAARSGRDRPAPAATERLARNSADRPATQRRADLCQHVIQIFAPRRVVGEGDVQVQLFGERQAIALAQTEHGQRRVTEAVIGAPK